MNDIRDKGMSKYQPDEPHEPTMEEKEDLFRPDDNLCYCDHNWIAAEYIDQPAGDGLIRNVSKLYCTKCDKMKEVSWK